MSKEIVKYVNDLNKMSFRQMRAVDIDLFWAIASKLREQGTLEITLSYDEIKNLSGWRKRNLNKIQFEKDLRVMSQKLMGLSTWLVDEHGTNTLFTLFPRFKHGGALGENLVISVAEEFEFVFNQLKNNFTRFELDSIIKLESSYTKEIFRRLMQFKGTGRWIVKMDDFREQLSIPKSYKQGNIDQQILNLAKRELTQKDHLGNQILEYLEIKKIKGGYRNLQVVTLEFHFRVPQQRLSPVTPEDKKRINEIEEYALDIARSQHAKNTTAYQKTILKDWSDRGYQTIDQIKEADPKMANYIKMWKELYASSSISEVEKGLVLNDFEPPF